MDQLAPPCSAMADAASWLRKPTQWALNGTALRARWSLSLYTYCLVSSPQQCTQANITSVPILQMRKLSSRRGQNTCPSLWLVIWRQCSSSSVQGSPAEAQSLCIICRPLRASPLYAFFYGEDPQLSLASQRLCNPKSRKKQDLATVLLTQGREKTKWLVAFYVVKVFSQWPFKFCILILYSRKGLFFFFNKTISEFSFERHLPFYVNTSCQPGRPGWAIFTCK